MALQKLEMHGPPRYFTPDWDAAEQSVRRLSELNPATIVSGHGQPAAGPNYATRTQASGRRVSDHRRRLRILRLGARTKAAAIKRPAPQDHRCPPHQESDVPIDPLLAWDGLIDVMEAEQLMIDQSFDDVEDAEPHKQGAGKHLPTREAGLAAHPATIGAGPPR